MRSCISKTQSSTWSRPKKMLKPLYVIELRISINGMVMTPYGNGGWVGCRWFIDDALIRQVPYNVSISSNSTLGTYPMHLYISVWDASAFGQWAGVCSYTDSPYVAHYANISITDLKIGVSSTSVISTSFPQTLNATNTTTSEAPSRSPLSTPTTLTLVRGVTSKQWKQQWLYYCT